jgi:LacI family transcriptional regulator
MAKNDKNSDRPVNLSDIAEAVGVSMMTVSLALRDHSRISEKTKKLVREKAEELGYVRDPELSRLMAYIRNRKAIKFQANLGFLHCLDKPLSKQANRYVYQLYDAAREQAAELGYSLNVIWLTEKGMTTRRVSQILDTRNIQGVLIAPLPRDLGFQPAERMDASKVSGVTVGYSVSNPRYSRITVNHYQAINLAMDNLWEMGYRRIGLAIEETASARVRDLWLAGFVAWQYTHFHLMRVSPLFIQKDWKQEMKDWMDDLKPDVVMTQSEQTQSTLIELGYKVPADVGVAYLNANFQKGNVSGIVQDIHAEGQLAIDYLVSQILSRRTGVPENNVTIMDKGSWRTGNTLKG